MSHPILSSRLGSISLHYKSFDTELTFWILSSNAKFTPEQSALREVSLPALESDSQGLFP